MLRRNEISSRSFLFFLSKDSKDFSHGGMERIFTLGEHLGYT